MPESKPWHEQDEFWDTFAPTLFTADHWTRAPEEVDHIVSLLGIEAVTPTWRSLFRPDDDAPAPLDTGAL